MSLSAGKVSYSSNLYVPVKEAVERYGLSESDVKSVNSNNDDKISVGELKSAGFGKYSKLAEHFNEMTKGALYSAEGIQPVRTTKTTAPGDFAKNTFNPKASLFTPEQRDTNNAAILGDAVLGKNLYLLG